MLIHDLLCKSEVLKVGSGYPEGSFKVLREVISKIKNSSIDFFFKFLAFIPLKSDRESLIGPLNILF